MPPVLSCSPEGPLPAMGHHRRAGSSQSQVEGNHPQMNHPQTPRSGAGLGKWEPKESTPSFWVCSWEISLWDSKTAAS